MTAVASGLPGVPARPIAPRRVSRRIQVGPAAVGGGAPVPSAVAFGALLGQGIGGTIRVSWSRWGCVCKKRIEPQVS